MPGKLFVGNLSFNVLEADLEQLCADQNVQAASVKIMRDRELGRSRGFAFIELAPEADMDAAIQALNGKELGGRALTVNEARPLEKRESSGGGPRFGNRPGGRGGRFGGHDNRRKERERPKRKTQELY